MCAVRSTAAKRGCTACARTNTTAPLSSWRATPRTSCAALPRPFDSGSFPLSYSGDPGANGVSYRVGCTPSIPTVSPELRGDLGGNDVSHRGVGVARCDALSWPPSTQRRCGTTRPGRSRRCTCSPDIDFRVDSPIQNVWGK